jgi:O-glycosyl hydrolase
MNGAVKGKKYYVSKQFYRYIRPGAIRVDATSSNASVFVSAYLPSDAGHAHDRAGQHVHERAIRDPRWSGLPDSFAVIRTSATDNAVDAGTYTTGASLSLPGRSIVTLQAGGTPLATP